MIRSSPHRRKGIVAVLRKPEIVNGIVRAVAEPCHIRIDAACGLLHLGGPEHAERGAPLRPRARSGRPLRGSNMRPRPAGQRQSAAPHNRPLASSSGWAPVFITVSSIESGSTPDAGGRAPARCTARRDRLWSSSKRNLLVRLFTRAAWAVSRRGVIVSRSGRAAAPDAAVSRPVRPWIRRAPLRFLRLATERGSGCIAASDPPADPAEARRRGSTASGSNRFSRSRSAGPDNSRPPRSRPGRRDASRDGGAPGRGSRSPVNARSRPIARARDMERRIGFEAAMLAARAAPPAFLDQDMPISPALPLAPRNGRPSIMMPSPAHARNRSGRSCSAPWPRRGGARRRRRRWHRSRA